MSALLAELTQQARNLPPHERARLVEVLLESLDGAASTDISAAWQSEIVCRVAAHDRGDAQTFSAEDVFAEARSLAG